MLKITINHVDDIRILRDKVGLERIIIGITAHEVICFHLGMVVRYIIWALAENGEAKIYFPKLENDPCYGRTAKWPLVIQLLMRWLRNDGELINIDNDSCCVVLVRHSKKIKKEWGCGLVVSGSESELPLVEKWIDSVSRQEGVVVSDVALCGPSGSSYIYRNFPVRYISFDDVKDRHGRFLISRKKNFLINSICADKVLISHARISLGKKCLSEMPEEFDLISPQVRLYKTDGEPYLDWNVAFVKKNSVISYSDSLPLNFQRNNWRRYYSFGTPYIDGGVFAVSKSMHNTIPMRDDAAWGEAEDVEWCENVVSACGLVELADNAIAISATNKLPRYEKYSKNVFYKIYKKLSLMLIEKKFG